MLSEIIHQHVTESSFLWGRRDLAVRSFLTMADVARLDLRLEAHLDGVRIAGTQGWLMVRGELEWKEAGEAFTAGLLAFENEDAERIDEVLQGAAGKGTLVRGLVSAPGWMEYEQAAPHIEKLCMSELRSHRRIGIAAAAVHRRDPGRALEAALGSGDRLLRARAYRAVGELGRRDLVPLLQMELTQSELGCRFWAAWSIGLIAGYSNAIDLLQHVAENLGSHRERAMQVVLRRIGIDAAQRWLKRLQQTPGGFRLAVIAAGALGDPAALPWLLEQMAMPELARVAGEAFSMITGADLAYEDLDRKKPEDFEAGPSEDPADDDVAMDVDERLPWPSVERIEGWLAKRRGNFAPGVRHLLGKPIMVDWMERVLLTGKQRQRAAAALELAILRPGSPLFEVRAPGFRQQQLLQYRSFR